jgi:Predicted flavoproteins
VKNVKSVDVIVIGGGAAGLFCAFTAGQRGRSVLVLDSSNKVGKKILMSGGGRCNFTNLDITPEITSAITRIFVFQHSTATTSGNLSISSNVTASPIMNASTVNCSATTRRKIFSRCFSMSVSSKGHHQN